MKKKIERERERESFFVLEKYAMNGREWKIYNKRLGIKRVKIKEDKLVK